MFKAVIFDFFDVIYTDSFQAWFRKHNFENKDELVEITLLVCIGKIDSTEFFKRLSSASNFSVKEIRSEFDESAKFDTDIVELIKFLHMHYKLGLISNAVSAHIRSLLKRYELESLFDEIIISSEVGILKPEPQLFHSMLDKLAVDPSGTIYIDDHQYNVDAAKFLGIHGILYRNFKLLREELTELGIISHK